MNIIASIKRDWQSRGWKTTGEGKLSQGELAVTIFILLAMLATPLSMPGEGRFNLWGLALVAALFLTAIGIGWHSCRETPGKKS